MMKTRSSLGLTLLVLIVYASKINIVIAKLCESEDGRSSKECDDDENCCESDEGEVECCTELGVVGIIVMIILLCGFTLCGLFICIFCWRKGLCQNNHMNGDCTGSQSSNDCLCSPCYQIERPRTVIVQTAVPLPVQRSAGVIYRTRRVSVPEPSNSGNVTLVRMNNVNKPSNSSHGNSNDHTNTLSTNNHCTNTNDDAPPPYCSDEAPPSYAEINL